MVNSLPPAKRKREQLTESMMTRKIFNFIVFLFNNYVKKGMKGLQCQQEELKEIICYCGVKTLKCKIQLHFYEMIFKIILLNCQ